MVTEVNQLAKLLMRKPEKDLDKLLRHTPPYIVDTKLDGEANILVKNHSATYIANGGTWIRTPQTHPHLFKDLPQRDFILYGELICGNGKSGRFYQFIDNRNSQQLIFVAFDILFLDGRDLRPLKLEERKTTLYELGVPAVFYTEARDKEKILHLFKWAVRDGYEGVVVKTNSSYNNGVWVKLKKRETIDAVVTGKAPGKEFSFEIALRDGDKWTSLGRASSLRRGVDPDSLKVGDVVEVSYQDILRINGNIRLRHPSIMRKRTDKSAEECTVSQVFGD